MNTDIAPARRSLRDGGLKYIQRIADDETMARSSYASKLGKYPWMAAKEELYDISSDPGEHRNIATSRPQELAKMRSEMTRLLAQGRAKTNRSSSQRRLSEDEKRRLKAMGYL